MLLVHQGSADEPTAPAIFQRCSIVGDKSASDVFRGHACGDVLRTYDQARYPKRLAALVTLQASDFAGRAKVGLAALPMFRV